MSMTSKINTFVYKNDNFIEKEDEIVSDETITLVINDSLTRSFSISPDSLKEFTVGYMLGEGLISSIENVETIDIEGNNISATIDLEDFDIKKELIVGSDCFGGWRSKIDFIDKVESDFVIDPNDLLENTEKIREKAITWKNTGGTHIASFINKEKNEFISREDISRHVAVDKVIGAAALKKLDFKNSYIIYSGRMPADVLIKIARVGIPIIASNAAPTLSGYTVADEANITMVGFIRGDKFNVYTHPERIIV
ncbi:formate dehydrogenase accessory protein FdhD [Methanobrevibacter arboriphilus JCM 13429 = DSM 1125]|uniref:Sulfur carrier protein FdhD n=2 Tax=Methanobrevibacter arboriphilus TaxID=39441 RepID=A0A1V6N020_METAZ|nr:formate dehydrogenase accessory sulfurtransferase FdhD [Methanobrevibacter arboriphilus]OQD57962.1 formate dehydrogenase accessory protein FdhD [Methanobrevibacter arboriphilus JCM 13429 = DSM 1125]